MSLLGPDDFLLGVEFQVTCSDGSVHENVAWKHCPDKVLRWYKTDGTQVRNISSVSGGRLLVKQYVILWARRECQEES